MTPFRANRACISPVCLNSWQHPQYIPSCCRHDACSQWLGQMCRPVCQATGWNCILPCRQGRGKSIQVVVVSGWRKAVQGSWLALGSFHEMAGWIADSHVMMFPLSNKHKWERPCHRQLVSFSSFMSILLAIRREWPFRCVLAKGRYTVMRTVAG